MARNSLAVLSRLQNDVARLIRILLFTEQQTLIKFPDIAELNHTRPCAKRQQNENMKVFNKGWNRSRPGEIRISGHVPLCHRSHSDFSQGNCARSKSQPRFSKLVILSFRVHQNKSIYPGQDDREPSLLIDPDNLNTSISLSFYYFWGW